MMTLATTRTEWISFSRTAPSDRTSLTRPRKLVLPRSLEERQRIHCATGSVRHADERAQFRKLLTEPEWSGPFTTRVRSGCSWGAMGNALRVCDDRPVDRSCPSLLNEKWDCFELDATFPEFCAIGARSLQPKLKNRLVFEVRTEPTSLQHIVQVGVAGFGEEESLRPSARLDESTPLRESVICTSAGDVISSVGPMSIRNPGSQGSGLRPRLDDWCCGAPRWLIDGAYIARIMLEVDLRLGQIAISLDGWSEDPAVVEVPALVESSRQGNVLFPFVSLTAVGQQARILDLHVCSQT